MEYGCCTEKELKNSVLIVEIRTFYCLRRLHLLCFFEGWKYQWQESCKHMIHHMWDFHANFHQVPSIYSAILFSIDFKGHLLALCKGWPFLQMSALRIWQRAEVRTYLIILLIQKGDLQGYRRIIFISKHVYNRKPHLISSSFINDN